MKFVPVLVLILSLAACSTKNSDSKTEAEEWKEMDSFHMIMAEAFHPYKDSANLAPAKTLAKDMADEAGKWVVAPLPEKVSNDEMKAKLKSLNGSSQEFLKLINDSAPDSTLAKSLTDLHNLFHQVQEEWYGESKKEKEHEH